MWCSILIFNVLKIHKIMTILRGKNEKVNIFSNLNFEYNNPFIDQYHLSKTTWIFVNKLLYIDYVFVHLFSCFSNAKLIALIFINIWCNIIFSLFLQNQQSTIYEKKNKSNEYIVLSLQLRGLTVAGISLQLAFNIIWK